MGIFLQVLGWIIAAVLALNIVLGYPTIETVMQQAVLWLMIGAFMLALVVIGIGAAVTAIGEASEKVRASLSPSGKPVPSNFPAAPASPAPGTDASRGAENAKKEAAAEQWRRSPSAYLKTLRDDPGS